MPIIKCPNPDCRYEGEGPSDEFCHLYGSALEAPRPKLPPIPVQAIKAKLAIKSTGRVGHEFPITGDSVNIGRLDPDGGVWPDIDLTQDDPETHVSRKHAKIYFKDGSYFIEDLDSANGTFVNNGPRLAAGMPQELKSGDEIVVGRTFLSFLTE